MTKLTNNQQYLVDERAVIIVTTDGTTIQGIVDLKGLERTSDLFTKDGTPFIIVYRATAKGHENRVLAINKNQIIWAEFGVDGDS